MPTSTTLIYATVNAKASAALIGITNHKLTFVGIHNRNDWENPLPYQYASI